MTRKKASNWLQSQARKLISEYIECQEDMGEEGLTKADLRKLDNAFMPECMEDLA